jgi:bifunctional non-homologous end joining protein LigD
MPNEGIFDIGGRRLTIRHLDRILFPQARTTKADVLSYYASISTTMLPHLADRLLHMHRYPEGVEGPRFWQKACPEHRPDWLATTPVWSRDKQAYIEYCMVNEPAALLWAVNLGSIELHSSLHTCEDPHRPTVLAFDLDPGPGTNILHCCEVALRLRELFEAMQLVTYPKTSGSKGLQLYLPLNVEITYEYTKRGARQVAELLEAQAPDAVVSRVARSARAGKVLIDWGQNTEHKSMVCAYSVRAKARPTVSTPLEWQEVEEAVDAGRAEQLSFEMADVLARVKERGDLFAPVLTRRQDLVAQARKTSIAIGGGAS